MSDLDEDELKATRRLNGVEKAVEINGYKLYRPKITVENLKVGYYVRTKSQGIKRIDTVWENKTVNKYGYKIGSEWDGTLYSTIKTTDILKFSRNIFDLIEVGDILKLKEDNEIMYFVTEYNGTSNIGTYDEIKDIIRSGRMRLLQIVTHEQFNSVAYRVEE